MPNVASVLREEIIRLARKEIRQQVGPLKKTNAELRRTVATLKRDVTELRRGVQFLEKQEKRRIMLRHPSRSKKLKDFLE